MNQTDKIELRVADEADLDAVYAIERASFAVVWSRESFLAVMKSAVSRVFVACCDGEIAGFGCMAVLAPEGEIMNLATAPAHRREGIGEALLDAMLCYGAENGVESVYLEVRESNVPARTLYRKMGFCEIGTRKNYYTHPTENAILMTKKQEISRKDEGQR